MIYKNIRQAIFIDRPNRFIAHVELDGKMQVCHVKNTGRCKELLIPGAEIFIQESENPDRKTKYDLISVYKGDRLINIDSSAPNKIFAEWIMSEKSIISPTFVKPECTHGDSRFDFYLESEGNRIFAEVKGVTLEDNGIVRFPDAPTLRGVKHMNGLIRCVEEGFDAWAVFIVQMENVKFFEPNRETHPQFGEALKNASLAGVQLIALDCNVTENSISAGSLVKIVL